MSLGIAHQPRPLNKHLLGRKFLPLFVFLLLSLAECVSANSTDGTTVSIGIVDNNMPYSTMKDLSPSGFSVDVLREMASNADITLEFQAGNWTEIYDAFLNGRIDAIDSISYREERAKKILFTEPYHIRHTYLMHNPDNPLGDISSLEALAGKRIGILRDIYYRDALTDSEIDLHTYDSVAGLIRALAFGWVDGIIGPQITLKYYAKESGLPFLDIAGPAPLGTLAAEDFRVGVLKGNEALHQRLSDALDAIPDARINELIKRWKEFGGASATASSGFVLSDADRRLLSETGPIRVGFMTDYAPFSFRDAGALHGLSVELMNRISDLTGLQVVPVSGQWSELYPSFVEGDIDVIANMSKTPERVGFTQFTRPYHVIPNVAFTKISHLNFNEPEDLKGLRVALGAGIYYENELREQLGENVFSYTSQRDMFAALAEDSVDVVLAALPNGNHWVREMGIPGVSIAGEVRFGGIAGEDLRFGVRSEIGGIAGIINDAMSAISPTEMNTIKSRWLGASPKNNDDAPGTVVLTPQEKAWLEKHDWTLFLCVDPNWMPLEGVNKKGEHVGISADVFRLFAKRSDIEFEPWPTQSWSETMEAAINKKCDVFPMAMKTPARTEYLNFTQPYLQLPSVLVGRIDSPFIDSLDELGSQPIGIVRNYALAELIRDRNRNLNLVEVSSEESGLRKVQNRELAAYIGTLATTSHYMQKFGLADLKVIGRVPADWSLSVASHVDHPELLSIMQKLVASLTEQEQRTIRQAWNRVELEQNVDYTTLIQITGIAALVLGLLFYWNRKLDNLNRELEVANDRLARLSVTDELTQIGNRGYFDREFGTSYHWCKRHRAGFAVAMVDADHFKQINDTYGHKAGDECLIALTDTMRNHFRRDTDRLSRFGGEEFVIFTTYDNDEDLAERFEEFRKEVELQKTPCDGEAVGFTVSIGLVTGVPSDQAPQSEFLRLADQALYLAKQNGRNRLEILSVPD